MQKFRFRALCLAGLLSTCLGGPAWANDRIDSALDAIKQEFRSGVDGMSHRDYTDLQMVHAYLRDRDFKAARDNLESLIQTYPERADLHLTLGQVYLQTAQAEEALNAFQAAEAKGTDLLNTFQRMETRLGMSQAHTQLKNYNAALEVLNGNAIDPVALNASEQETWYLAKAKAAYQLKDMESVYVYLEQSRAAGQGPAVLAFHQQVKTQLAEHKYQQGLAAYRREHFGEALKFLRVAMELNPNNIDYVRLTDQAHTRFIEEVRLRVQTMRPLLRMSLEEMRWALEVEDYDQVYREYQKLLQNPDVDFFIGNNYRSYLPDEMRSTLVFIENTLRARGYRVAV